MLHGTHRGERLQDKADRVGLILQVVGDDPAAADPEALDELQSAALAWSFVVIGEAVKALPTAVTKRHADVDWHGFARLRDTLAHQYFRIDPIAPWSAIRNDSNASNSGRQGVASRGSR